VEHSVAFRYFLLYRQWLDPARWPGAAAPSGTTAEGFYPLQSGMPLSAGLWERTRRTYASILSQPPSEIELAGLSRLLGLAADGTQIMVIEAPAHQRLRRWRQHASGFSTAALGALRQATREQHVMFRRVPASRVIPADGWADFAHPNVGGAERFSEWLGARVGTAVQAGRLKEPSPRATRVSVAQG